ncbi:dynein axonemal intermediate chain 7-like isoform X2 [Artemia franciscana]|uniref:dynein axonemal intermediate chain 7-like isoform X2 n=1 Tax=Artemia franciscana TaxID=6661 RepID=UPI0032DBEC03
MFFSIRQSEDAPKSAYGQETARLEEERIEQERREAQEVATRKAEENNWRKGFLTHTWRILNRCQKDLTIIKEKKSQTRQFNWQMRTDGLPNTLSIPELNAFRTRWKDVSDSAEPTIERVIERYPEAVRVVTDIDDLLSDLEEMSEEKLNMLIRLRFQIAKLLTDEVDLLTIMLLQDISLFYDEEKGKSSLEIVEEEFSIGLGVENIFNEDAQIQLHSFERIGVFATFPTYLVNKKIPFVLRIFWQKRSHQWDMPRVNEVKTWPTISQSVSLDEMLKVILTENPPIAPKPKESSALDIELFLLVGGVIIIDLFELLDQPKRSKYYTVTVVKEMNRPVKSSFSSDYTPLPPPDPRADPEDIEKELKLHEKEMDRVLISITIKLSKSILWLEAPKIVQWDFAEKAWKMTGVWDTRFKEPDSGNAASVTFRLEKGAVIQAAIQRRTNLPLTSWTLKPIAPKTQAKRTDKDGKDEKEDGEAEDDAPKKWMGGGGGAFGDEMIGMSSDSEDEEEEVLIDEEELQNGPPAAYLSIIGAVVTLDIDLEGNETCLRNAKNGPDIILEDLFMKKMTATQLIETLRSRGLEIAPSPAVRRSMDELPKKHSSVELHSYKGIALAAASRRFTFAWSRWNFNAGNRNMVLQVQGPEGVKGGQHQLIHISPEQCKYLACTEVSQALDLETIQEKTEIRCGIRSLCYMLPHQFGFQPKLGCFHALKCWCNLLIDADKSVGTLALGTYDVSKAFDSLLHPQAMNEILNRGVSLDLVRPLLYMYCHMKAKIRIPGSNLLTDDIPIHIGVKHGAVTSPTVYNNATLPAQSQLSSCSIYKA